MLQSVGSCVVLEQLHLSDFFSQYVGHKSYVGHKNYVTKYYGHLEDLEINQLSGLEWTQVVAHCAIPTQG